MAVRMRRIGWRVGVEHFFLPEREHAQRMHDAYPARGAVEAVYVRAEPGAAAKRRRVPSAADLQAGNYDVAGPGAAKRAVWGTPIGGAPGAVVSTDGARLFADPWVVDMRSDDHDLPPSPEVTREAVAQWEARQQHPRDVAIAQARLQDLTTLWRGALDDAAQVRAERDQARDEVERMARALAGLRTREDMWHSRYERACAETSDALQEVERLREEGAGREVPARVLDANGLEPCPDCGRVLSWDGEHVECRCPDRDMKRAAAGPPHAISGRLGKLAEDAQEAGDGMHAAHLREVQGWSLNLENRAVWLRGCLEAGAQRSAHWETRATRAEAAVERLQLAKVDALGKPVSQALAEQEAEAARIGDSITEACAADAGDWAKGLEVKLLQAEHRAATRLEALDREIEGRDAVLKDLGRCGARAAQLQAVTDAGDQVLDQLREDMRHWDGNDGGDWCRDRVLLFLTAMIDKQGPLKAAVGRLPDEPGELEQLRKEAADWKGKHAALARGSDIMVQAATEAREERDAARGELLAAQVSQCVARPAEDYHEDYGPVLWWLFPVSEAPWVGTPNDNDWPEYHTHWTPLPPVPAQPAEEPQDDDSV